MIAGFDIGGTKCAALIGEETENDIRIFDRREFKTEGTPNEVIDTYLGTARRVADLRQGGKRRVRDRHFLRRTVKRQKRRDYVAAESLRMG